MKFTIGLLLLIVLASSSARGDDPPGSIVLNHAFIPTADNVHGETRLLRLGQSACVQTILHSASFRRGVREIQLREADVWSQSQTGTDDSLKYREELERVKQLIVSKPRAESDEGQPYTLVIDFTFSPAASKIEFYHAEVEKGADTFNILSRAIISTIPVSDQYMSRAMLIMTAAAFGHHRNDSVALLEAAGWKNLSPVIDPQLPIPLRK